MNRTYLVALVALPFLSGCMSSNLAQEIEHGKPRYDERVDTLWTPGYVAEGVYVGKELIGCKEFNHYRFENAICWPTQSSNPDVELFVPLMTNGAPMINTYQGWVADSPNYQPDCILYIQSEKKTSKEISHQLELYYWKRGSKLQIGDVIHKIKDHPAVLSLVPTKDGAGSSLSAWQSSESGLLPFAEFTIQERPQIFKGEWWSPSDRFGYIAMIFTVPLDILTLPIQLFAGVVMGNMNHGMSPK